MSSLPPISNEPSLNLWRYADAQGRPRGPVSFDELKRLAAAGVVKPGTLVKTEGLNTWQPFSSAACLPDSAVSPEPPLPPACDQQRSSITFSSALAKEETEGRGVKAIELGCLSTVGLSGSFVAGFLVSLTGIGAIVGIPVMLLSVILAFIAPIMGWNLAPRHWLSGSCPYCEYPELKVRDNVPGVNCPACNKRIVIREKQFKKVG